MSSDSTGSNQAGVDISLVGLGFQVFTLLVFILLSLDYVVRWGKSESRFRLSSRFKIFASFLTISIILILMRCSYRIAELKDGYNNKPGSLISNQGLFIGLESV